MARAHRRPVWAEISRKAMVSNARAIVVLVAPAGLCAVVKADAYGHGAVDAARAFLEGGASCLAVALVEEGIELRRAGVDAPILLLSEPSPVGMDEAVIHRLTPTVYTQGGVDSLARSATKVGDGRSPVDVHVKVDTGMHRVGAAPGDATGVLRTLGASGSLRLAGIWTHLAVADTPEDPYTGRQLELFDTVLGEWVGTCGGDSPRGPDGDFDYSRRGSDGAFDGVSLHAANSAAAVSRPEARYSMVRCGLALYGYLPEQPGSPGGPGRLNAGSVGLAPVLSLKARVSYVKQLEAGERLSYGLAYEAPVTTTVATVPVGYADGVPRRFGTAGGQALIRGRRLPVAGNVTMDQLMVDCGPDAGVEVGDEVVMLGRHGEEAITAQDWAAWLGVIPYEVLCGIGPRVPRVIV